MNSRVHVGKKHFRSGAVETAEAIHLPFLPQGLNQNAQQWGNHQPEPSHQPRSPGDNTGLSRVLKPGESHLRPGTGPPGGRRDL